MAGPLALVIDMAGPPQQDVAPVRCGAGLLLLEVMFVMEVGVSATSPTSHVCLHRVCERTVLRVTARSQRACPTEMPEAALGRSLFHFLQISKFLQQEADIEAEQIRQSCNIIQ